MWPIMCGGVGEDVSGFWPDLAWWERGDKYSQEDKLVFVWVQSCAATVCIEQEERAAGAGVGVEAVVV